MRLPNNSRHPSSISTHANDPASTLSSQELEPDNEITSAGGLTETFVRDLQPLFDDN